MTPSTPWSASSACRCTTAMPRSSPGAAPPSFSGNIWGEACRRGSHSGAELLYDVPMMKILEDAIEKVQKLPEERQAYVAEVLEQIAAAGSDPFIVPEGHRAAVLEGLEQ